MSEGLFNEYRLLIAPVLLGKGRRLFPPGTAHQKLSFLEARPLTTGGIILRYAPLADRKS